MRSDHRQFLSLFVLHFCLCSVQIVSPSTTDDNRHNINNNKIDTSQVVLMPVGRETLIIDSVPDFHVNGKDSSKEVLEIRLIDDDKIDNITRNNAGRPVVVDLWKSMETSKTRNANEDAADKQQKSEEEEEKEKPFAQGQPERLEDGFPIVREVFNWANGPIEGSGQDDANMGQGEAEDGPIDTGDNANAAATEQNGDTKMNEPSSTVEQCLQNHHRLSTSTIDRLKDRRRKLIRLVRSVNRRQETHCRRQARVPFRKCPDWRRQKMLLYYRLMTLAYCADYTKWPHMGRIKRNYRRYLDALGRLFGSGQQ